MYEYEWRDFSSGGTVEGNSKDSLNHGIELLNFIKNFYQVI